MTEDFRELLNARRNAAATTTAPDDEEPIELEEEMPGACYSVMSADRMRKIMIEFRYRTGDSIAFGYSYLLAVSFNASKGITLDFGGKSVQISGRNLRPLCDAIVAQRVAWVREVESRHADEIAEKGSVIVTAITVQDG